MALERCETCGRHVRVSESSCPFCAERRKRVQRAAVKGVVAGAAGVVAMTIGLGCAYGMPEASDAGPDGSDDSAQPDASDASDVSQQ